MKNNTSKIVIGIVLILIIGAVVWKYNSSATPSTDGTSSTDTTSVPTSQTMVVSNKVSEYKNEELGFSVKYPTAWVKTEAPTNVSFVIPIDVKDTNTVNNLEAKVDIISGKCTFPPVTTVKERDTLKVGDSTFNMISIANTVKTRNFFNRMYSLQKDSICYFFTFSSQTTNPTSKGLSGSDAQKAAARNTAMVDAADSDFKDMIKSFKFVVGAAGKDETTVSPK